MLALNEEQAAMLFAKMDDEEIGELSLAMANLGTMNSETIEEVFDVDPKFRTRCFFTYAA